MKKNYITPKMKLACANFDAIMFMNVSRINNNDDGEGTSNPGDVTDVDVGTKNRFYNDSDEGWE